jgi:ABC-type multidrug transport system fused ATPase/permease subunit
MAGRQAAFIVAKAVSNIAASMLDPLGIALPGMSRPRLPVGAGLPANIFRYVVATSAVHQALLSLLTIIVFVLDVVPLELQRRAVNDLVEGRAFRRVVLIALGYTGIVLVQGSTKLGLNVYRGWVGERAKRDLRRRIRAVVAAPPAASPAAEAQGIASAMIVAEVEPIGGFLGESISEPLLQCGILLSVLAYIVHIDPWMALAAFAIFVPQFVFVPLLQAAVNRRTGARIQVLRRLGIGVIANGEQKDPSGRLDEQMIERAFALDMGIFRLKFTMNFLMNLGTHLQVIAAFLVGGWWVYTGRLEIGSVVAFLSGIGRLTDPWGDLVNYFRDVTATQVKYRLFVNAIDRFSGSEPAPRAIPG